MTIPKLLLILWSLATTSGNWEKYNADFNERLHLYLDANVDGSEQRFLNQELNDLAFDIKVGFKKADEKNSERLIFTLAMFHEHSCDIPEACRCKVLEYGRKILPGMIRKVKEGLEHEGSCGKTCSRE